MNNKWNPKYEWCFSSLGTGDKVGVNNAGIGIFRKQPYIGLAKEVLQNVIDAKDKDVKGPARACFELIEVSKDEIPGAERLCDVISRCYDYYHEGDDGEKMRILKTAAEEMLDESKSIPVLKISDYNTVGLTGAREEKGSNWTGLVREISATNKTHGSSGSFGVGKFAPFNFSSVRTILYSTYNKDGERAIQGKTILTTFVDEDKKKKQNVGLFGCIEDEDCKAIYDNDVPDIYKRSECGTDLFVLGFKNDSEWMNQIALSVIEHFFFTIKQGNLEVVIKNKDEKIEITQESLPRMIEEYKKYCDESDEDIPFSAPEYWELLNDPTIKHFKEDFKGMGNVELYLKVDSEISDKKVLEMRKAGMRIQEDSAFRTAVGFKGIFIATGDGSKSEEPKDNINSFLRKCENQAHSAWSKDEYEDHEKEAASMIRAVHKWILDKVKSETPQVEEEEKGGYGLSDLLPNIANEGDEKTEEKAFKTFIPSEPKPLEVEAKRNNKNAQKATDVSVVQVDKSKQQKEEVVVVDPNGDIDFTGGGEGPYKDKNRDKNWNPNPNPHPGPFPGPYPVDEPKEYPGGDQQDKGNKKEQNTHENNKTVLHSLPIDRIRTPYNESVNEYRVSFTCLDAAENIYVRIRLGSDDDEKKVAEIKEVRRNDSVLEKFKDYIVVPNVEKNEKVILNVKFRNIIRSTLEVTAYVK